MVNNENSNITKIQNELAKRVESERNPQEEKLTSLADLIMQELNIKPMIPQKD